MEGMSVCGALDVRGTLVLHEGFLTLLQGESFHVLLYRHCVWTRSIFIYSVSSIKDTVSQRVRWFFYWKT